MFSSCSANHRQASLALKLERTFLTHRYFDSPCVLLTSLQLGSYAAPAHLHYPIYGYNGWINHQGCKCGSSTIQKSVELWRSFSYEQKNFGFWVVVS